MAVHRDQVTAGGEGSSEFGAERDKQPLGLVVAEADAIPGQGIEEDLRLGATGHLRQLHQRTTCDGTERLRVRGPHHLHHVDQGQVDVPQHQSVNRAPPPVMNRSIQMAFAIERSSGPASASGR
jgi:hypothetical protein